MRGDRSAAGLQIAATSHIHHLGNVHLSIYLSIFRFLLQATAAAVASRLSSAPGKSTASTPPLFPPPLPLSIHMEEERAYNGEPCRQQPHTRLHNGNDQPQPRGLREKRSEFRNAAKSGLAKQITLNAGVSERQNKQAKKIGSPFQTMSYDSQLQTKPLPCASPSSPPPLSPANLFDTSVRNAASPNSIGTITAADRRAERCD